MTLTILAHGFDAGDVRADDSSTGLPSEDDAVALSNDIFELIKEEYEYLGVTGVEVDVRNTRRDEAPDFPED